MISKSPQKARKSNGKAPGPHVVVVRVPMSRITIHPRNPRRGNVEHIRRSLIEFGQFKPLVVQKSTGHILCGNHTYTAAQELGWSHIDVHYENVDDPKAFRLALADNGTSDLTEWDQKELASMLADAGENIPGFDEDFLKQLERDLRAAGGAPDPGPQIGRAEELAREWGTEEGQLWMIPSLTRPGHHHRIICGDSTKKKVVDRVLAGARPKLMVTEQKPLECMERPIRNHDGDVYDPFLGSGSTMIAAERQGRICYGIELMPECMGIILQRCKDFGMEPEMRK